MIRSVALTSVMFSALLLSSPHLEAKAPNVPKFIITRTPIIHKIPRRVLNPANINASDEEEKSGEAGKKKKQKSEFARNVPAPKSDVAKKKQKIPAPTELPFSEEAAGLITVFGGDPDAIKDFKKIVEHLENGPLRIDPLTREGESGQWNPDNTTFGAGRPQEDDKNDHNPFNDYPGSPDGGVDDRSGQASQDGGGNSRGGRFWDPQQNPDDGFDEWDGRSPDGTGYHVSEIKRPQGSETTIERDDGNTTRIWNPSSATQEDGGDNSRAAVETVTYGEREDGGEYRSVETRWEDGTFTVEIYGINKDGTEVLLASGRGRIDDEADQSAPEEEADQPAPDDAGQSGGNDNCGWRPFQGCTKTWSTPRPVNPGPQNPEGSTGTVAMGPGQSPGWATDPVEEGTGRTGREPWEPPPIGDPGDPPEPGPI